MNSMTGFGKGSASLDGRTVSIEMKSVNHRFLDINVKLPKGLAFVEDTVKKQIMLYAKRGHFDVTVGFENVRKDRYTVKCDLELAESYYEAIKSVADTLTLPQAVTASYITGLPGVMDIAAREEEEDVILKLTQEAAGAACLQLTGMRKIEGEYLKGNILQHLLGLEKLQKTIAGIAPSVPLAYKEKLEARIRELGAEADPQRVATEVAIMADKCAIDEELTRLESHISQMRSIAAGEGEAGKKLDFITQELNRECNTIGSKAMNLDITKCVVEAKNIVEKIREQVQNLE